MVAPKRLLDNNGSILIRFSHNGIRFNLSKLGHIDDPVANRYARSICDRIAFDIASRNFHCTNNGELVLRYHPSAIPQKLNRKLLQHDVNEDDVIKVCLIELNSKPQTTITKTVKHYLENYTKKITTKKDANDFLLNIQKERQITNKSLDRYLDLLKTLHPLFKELNVKVEVKPINDVFNVEQVNKILKGFEKEHDYVDFVKFLFLTGCRISEAIGLKRKHINFERRVIHIYESLGRGDNDSSGNRVQRTTKNNILREFPINDVLFKLLTKYDHLKSECLVFVVNGHCVNDRQFRKKWKEVLNAVGVPYMAPRNTRNTFITHYLEQTHDVVQCAVLTHGSRSGIETIHKHYVGLIKKPVVPNLY
jgi:integrase